MKISLFAYAFFALTSTRAVIGQRAPHGRSDHDDPGTLMDEEHPHVHQLRNSASTNDELRILPEEEEPFDSVQPEMADIEIVQMVGEELRKGWILGLGFLCVFSTSYLDFYSLPPLSEYVDKEVCLDDTEPTCDTADVIDFSVGGDGANDFLIQDQGPEQTQGVFWLTTQGACSSIVSFAKTDDSTTEVNTGELYMPGTSEKPEFHSEGNAN